MRNTRYKQFSGYRSSEQLAPEESLLLDAATDRLKRGDYDEAERRFLELYDHRCSTLPPLASALKLSQDAEQMEYLVRAGKLDRKFLSQIRIARSYLSSIRNTQSDSSEPMILMTGKARKELACFFGKPFSLYRPRASRHTALSPKLDARRIIREYKKSGFTVIDGVLNESTIVRLRRFCLESAIWHGVSAHVPQIDSQLNGGFCCGLLFQIARELHALLPGLLRRKSLHWIAGFRYPHPSDGIRTHADRSVITANLWITPDAANLDPTRGGMMIYPWRAKLRGNGIRRFQEYDFVPKPILRSIATQKEKGIRIPYRCNRLVLFDSTRYHCTDKFHFADGFENRRLSIALLFGARVT